MIKTIDANVATLAFIARGLPGAPENYKVTAIETVEGAVISDWTQPPPDTVYVTGSIDET